MLLIWYFNYDERIMKAFVPEHIFTLTIFVNDILNYSYFLIFNDILHAKNKKGRWVMYNLSLQFVSLNFAFCHFLDWQRHIGTLFGRSGRSSIS